MLSELLDAFARMVTIRRVAVLVVTVLVTAVFAAGIPRLQADFTPSDLFARFEDEQAAMAEFQATFGNTDNVALVVIQSESVWDPDVMAWMRDVAEAADAADWSARVDALTGLPVAHEPDVTDEEVEASVFTALYRVGAGPANQVRGAVATLSGEDAPVVDDTIPDTVRALAAGETITLGPAFADELITAEQVQTLHDTVAESPLVVGQLVSGDGRTTVIAIQLADGMDRNDEVAACVHDLLDILDARPPPDGTTFDLGGLPWLRTALIERMRKDQSVLLPLAILVCVVLLFAAFRWGAAMYGSTLAVVISAVVLVGGMAWVGEPFNLLNNIIPLVIIVIGISDAIHLINRYLEELDAGRSQREAAQRTVYTMTIACFLTSFTTAVGFASLAVSQTEILRRFGWTAAVGVLIAYVVTITLLPALLTVIKRPKRSNAHQDGRFEDAIEALTRGVMRHPWPVLAVTTVVLGAAGWSASQVVIDNAVLDQFDENDDITVTTRLLEEQLTGIRPVEVYLTSDVAGRYDDPEVLAALDRVAAWAKTQDGVIGTTHYGDVLREVRVAMSGDADARTEPLTSREQVELLSGFVGGRDRNPLAQWVNDDRTRLRLNIRMVDVGARATIAFGRALDAQLEAELGAMPDVTARITGDAWVSSLGLDAVINDLLGSLGLAIIIIFGFMTLLFGSPRLGLLSIPPNITPLVITGAWMTINGVPLNAATVIIFSVSIGLAVDGTIHVLARFREEVDGESDVDAALVRSARGTGKAIVLTTVSLMLGFGVMLMSSFVPVRRFGTLIGVTVFGTLVATVIVLPAMLKVAWTPRRAARLSEDLRV